MGPEIGKYRFVVDQIFGVKDPGYLCWARDSEFLNPRGAKRFHGLQNILFFRGVLNFLVAYKYMHDTFVFGIYKTPLKILKNTPSLFNQTREKEKNRSQ